MIPLVNTTKYGVAIITMSDSGSKDDKVDACELAIYDILLEHDWSIVYTAITPDEYPNIQEELLHCSDKMQVTLVLTTGGTGFSNRDITPEATKVILQKEVLGIPELMRAELAKTSKPMSIVSRGVAGIRNNTLIVNLPDDAESLSIALNSFIGGLKEAVVDLVDAK